LKDKAPYLFQLALALLLALGAWQCRNGLPIDVDLMTLLPHSRQGADAPLRQLAVQRVQQPLSRQMLALVSHADSEQALNAAKQLAQRWQESHLFAKVELEVAIDLAALRQQLLTQRLGLLPAELRKQLRDNPDTYLKQRAAELADPFSSSGIIPLAQDWLGLAQHAQTSLQAAPNSASA